MLSMHLQKVFQRETEYSEKDAFIEKFIPNGSTENFGDDIPLSSPNPVLDARKNNYKRWLEEKL